MDDADDRIAGDHDCSVMTPSGWKVLDTGVASAAENMAMDARLLEGLSASDGTPILHLYDWEAPSATYGYFIEPAQLLSDGAAALQLARRSTGGGMIFHIADWAFSVLVPAQHAAYSVNTLDNYAYVNALVIELVRRFAGRHVTPSLLPGEPSSADRHARHFCMAKPTRYDVMVGGRKVGGGAQRRTRHGFLHQGTISLALPDEAFLEKVLLPGTAVATAMRQHTCALLPGTPTTQQIQEARHTLAKLFKQLVS